jgi:hypothetical protein
VSDELAVVAESKEVAGDMITEAVLDQVRPYLSSEFWFCRFMQVKLDFTRYLQYVADINI